MGKNAVGKTNSGESIPVGLGDELAVGRCATRRAGGWGKERECSNESDRRVKERDGISPSDVGFRIRGGGWSEKNLFMIIKNAVKGSCELVP
jgi:hypothetical protein